MLSISFGIWTLNIWGTLKRSFSYTKVSDRCSLFLLNSCSKIILKCKKTKTLFLVSCCGSLACEIKEVPLSFEWFTLVRRNLVSTRHWWHCPEGFTWTMEPVRTYMESCIFIYKKLIFYMSHIWFTDSFWLTLLYNIASVYWSLHVFVHHSSLDWNTGTPQLFSFLAILLQICCCTWGHCFVTRRNLD